MSESPGSNEPQVVAVTYDIKLTPKLVFSIVGPYVYGKVAEQVKALTPICLFLFLFQWVVFRERLLDAFGIAAGLTAVIMGLMFFIDGLRLGVMPLGENIGSTLPAKAKMTIILTAAFLLGTIATFAEPAVATLQVLGSKIIYEKAPLLFDYLNTRNTFLLWTVAAGVGIGAINGIYRFVKGWSLKVTILPGLTLTVILTIIASFDQYAKDLIGVAWDAGGITTGTVTAPLVLALGVGMASALGKSDTGMSGFGIITLCSIWPITLVLGAALYSSWTGHFMTPDQYEAYKQTVVASGDAGGGNTLKWIGEHFYGAASSILPLIVLLMVIQKWVLRDEIRNLDQVIAGIVLALLGLFLFHIGLEKGLTPFGEQVGSKAANAFSPDGGLYGSIWGKLIVLLFGFIAGYGATIAEPALVTLGMTVEDVTAGALKKYLVMHSVGFGVGVGLVIGVAKIMFHWSAIAIILPSYVLVLILTMFSEEKYVNIGWDSGGVTTGDITSPVLISLGLGVAAAVGAADGFTLIAMGSVWPIISVLALGIFINKTTPFVKSRTT